MDVEDNGQEGGGGPAAEPGGLPSPPPAERGLETRRQKAAIEAALFGEPDQAPAPIRIGRFIIVRELGAGGMGVVYVAYDDQLDRRVAVKLLHKEAGGGQAGAGQTGAGQTAEAQARLQREAQAMARLTSPHVVTVHEVGTHEGQVFVAMEFVEGATLRGWLRAKERAAAEVLPVFLAAGEGLAHAHEAGIVHRDFKPDNVLVGRDGRVCVADFGLAHAFEGGAASGGSLGEGGPAPDVSSTVSTARLAGLSSTAGSSNARLQTPLTRTGAIMGTPAYMAPEQFAGQKTDARTDQFCFCVALWEGLYDQRPYAGLGFAELVEAVRTRQITEPDSARAVPAWMREIVLRGLDPDPAQRWPSMRALLDALAVDPVARRRRVAGIGLSVSLAAALVVASTSVATGELRENARQRYWNALTEDLLEVERERGFRQATEDALRSRDATRMSVFRRYRPKIGASEHEDPTVAAMLLREVEGEARESEAWVSAANQILSHPLSHTIIEAHTNIINAIVFSPDAGAVYTCSDDGEVSRWELATGAGGAIIRHGGAVEAIALSPDGRTLVSASRDGSARRWSVDDPEVSTVLTEHGDALTDVAFAPSGRWVATASRDGTVKLSPAGSRSQSQSQSRTLRGHEGTVYAVAFDARGELLASAGADGRVLVWGVEDGGLRATFQGHTEAVFHVAFLPPRPDGISRVVSGADDGSLRLWTLGSAGRGSPELGEELARHDAPITALAVHGDKVAVSTEVGAVEVISTAPKTSKLRLVGHTDGVWALAFAPEGDALLSGSFDLNTWLWPLDGHEEPRELVGHRITVYSAAFESTGRWVATGSYDGVLRIWSRDQARPQVTPVRHDAAVVVIEADAERRALLTAGKDGIVELWALDPRGRRASLDRGEDRVTAAAFEASGEGLVLGSASGRLTWWEPGSGEVQEVEAHAGPIYDLSVDAREGRLASASADRRILIWDWASRAVVNTLEGHTDIVHQVAFTGVGAQLVSTGADGSIRLWDGERGVSLAMDESQGGRLVSLARSPADAEVWATASDGGSAALWRITDDIVALATLRGHTQQVWSVAFDASGERVVTGSFDGSAKLWSVPEGRLLDTIDAHSEAVWAAAFVGPDRLLTVSDDNTARLWSLAGSEAVGFPVVLPQDGAVIRAVTDLEGGRFVTGSAGGQVSVWSPALLSPGPARLQARLDALVIACLSPAQRERDLGESPVQAQREYSACERAHHRQ